MLWARGTASALLLLLLAGCAPGLNYRTLDSQMRAGDCDAATGYIEKSEASYGSNCRLIFLMDAAAVNMYCGRLEISNHYLHEADLLAEDLWTKSITREGVAFLVNDYTIAYSGEDFEKAFINMLSAINYAVLGRYDEALVECRRLNSKLVEINEKYEKKSVYKEDAFGRYLSGLLYEASGMGSYQNMDSAFIDYDRAYTAFSDYEKDYGTPVPGMFIEDYLRVAGAAGRLEEAKARVGSLRGIKWLDHREARGLGRIVFIHMNGRAPYKVDDKLLVPSRHGPITLAFPRYVAKGPGCRTSELVVSSRTGTLSAGAELVEDVGAIAVKNLEDRMGRVVAKTIARAVAKQAAIDAASRQFKDKQTGELARLGLNILNIALERADTRSWRTLPAEIYLARLFLPAGDYKISGRHCGKTAVLHDSIKVRAGETRFVLMETVY